jgi:Zn finger protein HypA/HybF involved in hydrogenase expression
MPLTNTVEATAKAPAAADIEAQCPINTEHHQVYCPTCSSRLQDSRCKLVCRTCGYFLSCADFY